MRATRLIIYGGLVESFDYAQGSILSLPKDRTMRSYKEGAVFDPKVLDGAFPQAGSRDTGSYDESKSRQTQDLDEGNIDGRGVPVFGK